jgi:hypothetical protein
MVTDLTVMIHFAFLIFVVAGGIAARRYRWLIVPHLLCVAWAIYVEATPGLVCPLTPLENYCHSGGFGGLRGQLHRALPGADPLP